MTLSDLSFIRDLRDPRRQAVDFQRKLAGLAEDLRDSGDAAKDPKGQALFQTAAAVLVSLGAAFDHYARQAGSPMMESVADLASRAPRQEAK